jgi:hypothetical protein
MRDTADFNPRYLHNREFEGDEVHLS